MPCLENNFGLVFSMTNATDNNVVVFERNFLGRLNRIGAYSTGGNGTGAQQVDPLSSQGSLVVSRDGKFLFAVNAGNSTVSSFRILGKNLALASVVPSGGVRPVCLASLGDALYVANAGDGTNESNIAGLWVDCCGELRPIVGSIRSLSEPHAQPASVAASPCARVLVVSELSTNRLTAYSIHRNGTPTVPNSQPSNGASPFGSTFVFNGVLLVSEAGPDALSSYDVDEYGNLSVISGSVRNGQRSTCWVSVTPDGRNAYTSNAGTGTISRYQILDSGQLIVLGSETSTPDGTGVPLDSAIDDRGRILYVLNGNKGTISVFDIAQDGDIHLTEVFTDTALPQIGAQGMAIR